MTLSSGSNITGLTLEYSTYHYAGVGLDFRKGGTARSVIIVYVGPAGICTLIVCKAHNHA